MEEMNNFDQIYQLIINTKDYNNLHNLLKEYHPYDLAQAFKKFNLEERNILYKYLPSEDIADIFEYLDETEVVEYLNEMDVTRGASILNDMETDDATDVINEMDENDAINIINKMDRADKEELNYLSTHREDTAGSIMTTNYIQIEGDWDVKDAMKHLISEANEAEIIDPLFVCSNNKLIGILELKDLIIARSPCKISSIMRSNYTYATTTDSVNDVAKIIQNYDLHALPVIDNLDLVGVITADDALDVIQDEATDDYNKIASIGNEIEGRYSVLKTLFSRLPWLIILLVLSLIISNVISAFEGIIKQVTVLVFFQTLILDMAGNIGTQSLAVTIRNISRGDLDQKGTIYKHFLKEIKITLINSILLGILAFIVCSIFLLIRNSTDYNIYLISLVVSISMTIALILSGLLGAVLPILFYKIKIDPAVASGPFISTLNDLLSVVVYFSLAALMLGLI